MTRIKINLQKADGHLDDAELMLFCDGELHGRRLARAQAHVDGCWSCKAKLAQQNDAIAAYIDFRGLTCSEESVVPPRNWGGFDNRLADYRQQLQRETPSHEGWLRRIRTDGGRWLEFLGSALSQRVVIAATLALCVTASSLMVLHHTSAPTVDAAMLIINVEHAQSQRLEALPNATVYRRLQISDRGAQPKSQASGIIEQWSQPATRQLRTSEAAWLRINGKPRRITTARHAISVYSAPPESEPTSLSAIERSEFASADVPLLSPESLRHMEQISTPQHMSVARAHLGDGASALLLKFVRGADKQGMQTSAEVLIREADLRAISETLRIWDRNTEQTYEIAELDYKEAPLNAFQPDLFSPLGNDLRDPILAPLIAAISRTELDAFELDARVALHAIHADQGEPVEIHVEPSSSSIVVDAIAVDDQRAAEIRQALLPIPHLMLKLTTERELARNSVSQANNRTSEALEDSGSTEETSTQRILESYFLTLHRDSNSEAARLAAQRFGENELRLSDSVLADAWALRKLSKRYTSLEIDKLSPSSQRQLASLIRDDVNQMELHVSQLQSVLTPVLSGLIGGKTGQLFRPPLATEFSRWPNFAFALFGDVSRVDQLSAALFGGAQLPVVAGTSANGSRLHQQSLEECASDLQGSLVALHTDLTALKSKISVPFLSSEGASR